MAGLPTAGQGGGGGTTWPPRAPAYQRPTGRPSHRRAARDADAQEVWVGFGGRADQPWLRLLAPGFRHCFAAVRDVRTETWTVLDPLSGRLLVAALDVPPGFDLPGFWRRAGHAVLGPFAPAAPRPALPSPLLPMTCVGLVRALLGPGAPFALTPRGLYRALGGARVPISAAPKNLQNTPRNVLTTSGDPG